MTKTKEQIRNDMVALRLLSNGEITNHWWSNLDDAERALYEEIERERVKRVMEACERDDAKSERERGDVAGNCSK